MYPLSRVCSPTGFLEFRFEVYSLLGAGHRALLSSKRLCAGGGGGESDVTLNPKHKDLLEFRAP